MKTLLTTLLAAALVVPAAAQAQPAQHNRGDDRPHYSQQDQRNDRRQQQAAPSRHQQQQQHRFSKGERFDRNRATNYQRINYRQNRKLAAPPRNQVWVRSGSDALLVLLSNNIIQRVVPNAF